jgi:Family of unknown function (DUF6361)
MESAFGWTQIARSDVAKAAKLLKGEEGVRDEIGFLMLHQGFADRFFPGTSVLQTRLRYALFVPWQIEDLEQHRRAGGWTAEQRLGAAERRLVLRLRRAGDGVIGLRSANYAPSQPPSIIYWTALRVWGILNPSAPGVWPGRAEVLGRVDSSKWTDDRTEDGTSRSESTFFALPQRPKEWHESGELTFRLTRLEKRYLLERLEEAKRIAPGRVDEQSLLSRLAKAKPQQRPTSWLAAGFESPLVRELADAEDRVALRQAMTAASLAHIGRAVYSALVERLESAKGRENDGRFEAELTKILTEKRESALECDLRAVERFIGPLEQRFRAALAETLEWLKEPRADVKALWKPYCESERWRKDRRARLPKTPHAESLRTTWLASKPPSAQPLNYRWHRVGTLLDDLHGLHG